MKRYGVRLSIPAWAHSSKPAGDIDQLRQSGVRQANASSATL